VNQNIIQDVQQVVPMALAAGMFPNLCTIQAIPGTLDSLGAPITTFSDVSGLVDIPCHSAPPAIEQVRGSDELRMKDRVDVRQQRHVLLSGYFPTIVQNMRAVVDGEAWNIIGVESDAFNSQTRLMAEEYVV
jgi:hypothetical protein